MRVPIRRVRLFCSALPGLLFAAATQAAVSIPGTSVELNPPQGFRIARNFAGLENTMTGSMIQIAEYPPDKFEETAAVFASPKTASTRYASEGVRFTRIEPVAVEGGSVPLAIGQQVKNGREFQKYVTVLGGGKANAVLVTFTIGTAQAMSRGDVETVVRSIKVKRLPTKEETLASLAFVFKEVPPYRFLAAPDPNSARLVTFEDNDPTGLKPLAVITRAATSALPSESAKLAEQNLKGMAANAVIKQRATAPFGGGQGAFLTATVENRTVLMFVRVLAGGSYLQLLAVGETAQMEDARDATKELAASVDLR